jgi:cytochrome c5
VSGGDAGDYTLNTYTGIMQIVQAGNAGGSTLIEVVSGGQMPPQGYTALTTAQISLLSKWINQGALNNSCTETSCDTSAVTYSGVISSILQTNCTGCHSGSAPSGGGVDLTSYAHVLAQVNTGKLWGDVKHLSGYNAMPLGGGSLSACELSKINSWIKAGAPNN